MTKELTKKEESKKKLMKEIFLETPYNRANYYCSVMETMKKKKPLALTIGIEPNFGVPFYQAEINGIKKTIFIRDFRHSDRNRRNERTGV